MTNLDHLVLTPAELSLVLWYYARGDEHPDVIRQSPNYPGTITRLVTNEGLLQQNARLNGTATFMITKRGEVYIEHLLRQPLPVQRWVIPTREEARWNHELLRES